MKHGIQLVVCTFLLAELLFGQGSQLKDVCNADFAKMLVEQQVAEGRTVAETDKRVRILIRSADFLWKFDEPTSREYFAEAYKVANDRLNEKGFERQEFPGGGIYVQLPDHRFEVLRAII